MDDTIGSRRRRPAWTVGPARWLAGCLASGPRQAGLLFLVVGLLGAANDLSPGTIAHGQAVSLLTDLINVTVGAVTLLLPWGRWDPRWTLALVFVAFGDIAFSNTVIAGSGPVYGIYFIVVFAWIGAWQKRWTSLLITPIAVIAYVAPELAGTEMPTGTLPAIGLILPVGILIAETIAHNVELVRRGSHALRHQALHDALTGLPNRALIVDRAEHLVARSRREPTSVGVLFVDLDNFKDINDSFGHPVGDQLLKAVGARLAAAVRTSDSVGRMGGDEFVVLVEGSLLDAGADLVAQRVLDVLAEPFVLEGVPELTVRASIGVAVGTRSSADDLLRDADVALYQAKQAGKGRFVLFHPEMQLAVQDRLVLEMDLRHAVAERQLFVEYQPTFDLKTLAMTGVEALARWRHPQRGMIGPDQFIAIAEDSGLIYELGHFVLTTACRQAARWAGQGHVVPLSVNVSGYQLESGDFAKDVRHVLEDTGLDPSLLTLELTESVLMREADTTIARLGEIRDMGVRVAIDDFGTGYSSLAYLRRFPVDALKIDRSFISGISRSTEARALIRTLVQLGKTLGLETLAEGIEDQAQLTELQREDCDRGQGFYYSRPVPPSAIPAMFEAEHAQLQAAVWTPSGSR